MAIRAERGCGDVGLTIADNAAAGIVEIIQHQIRVQVGLFQRVRQPASVRRQCNLKAGASGIGCNLGALAGYNVDAEQPQVIIAINDHIALLVPGHQFIEVRSQLVCLGDVIAELIGDGQLLTWLLFRPLFRHGIDDPRHLIAGR